MGLTSGLQFLTGPETISRTVCRMRSAHLRVQRGGLAVSHRLRVAMARGHELELVDELIFEGNLRKYGIIKSYSTEPHLNEIPCTTSTCDM